MSVISFFIAAAMAAALLSLVQRPSDRSVAAFAKVYEVPLTSGNVTLLRGYIWWTRCWRVGGAAIAVAAAAVVQQVRNGAPTWEWGALVVGYGVGSLVGEALRPRRTVAGSRAMATLERRATRDYVNNAFLIPAATVVASAVIGALSLAISNQAVAGWFLTAPNSTSPLTGPLRVGRWYALAAAAVIVAVAAAAWLVARSVARSSMPADSPERMAVHHGIRSAAMISLGGATVMLVGAIGAQLGFQATLIDGDASSVMQWVTGLAAFWCSLAVMWGGLMTWNAVPRFALLAGHLPDVPRAAPQQEPC